MQLAPAPQSTPVVLGTSVIRQPYPSGHGFKYVNTTTELVASPNAQSLPAGASFDDAVGEAQRLSSSHPATVGFYSGPAAVGVLQADEGFRLVLLADAQGKLVPAIGGAGYAKTGAMQRFTAASDALRAVVGAEGVESLRRADEA